MNVLCSGAFFRGLPGSHQRCRGLDIACAGCLERTSSARPRHSTENAHGSHGKAQTYGNLSNIWYMFIFNKSIYVHMFLLFNRPLTSINKEFYEGESESLGIPLTPTSAALGTYHL